MLVTLQKEKRIIKLLHTKMSIKKIGQTVGAGNWTVYRIMEETGIRTKKPKVEEVEIKDDFVCPGFNHCVTCKRIFEYPCPLSS